MKKLEPIFDIIGEILAVLMVIVYIVSLANAQWSFINNTAILNILNITRTYGSILLVGVVGMEAMCKRNLVFRIIFYVCIAIIVIFLFFPATYSQLIGFIS
ncbi:MAG: hypothetical protein IJB97_04560 [Clostridia bacterium]|nr:hypothetical protein [Clostridia bacterium]